MRSEFFTLSGRRESEWRESNQQPAPADAPAITVPFSDASFINKSRPTSFHRNRACSVLPPEHSITSAHSTTNWRISSSGGSSSTSDTLRRSISQSRSRKVFVTILYLSVLSNEAVPTYKILGLSFPDSSITLSTIAGSCKAFIRPAATIFGTTSSSSDDRCSVSLSSVSADPFGGSCWTSSWRSSATLKSVSTCSSRFSRCGASLGSGRSRSSSSGTGSSKVKEMGTDAVPPVCSSETTTWQVASPSPLTTIALSPSTTKAAFSSIPIAGASGCSAIISCACSALDTSLLPVASKWGTHIALI